MTWIGWEDRTCTCIVMHDMMLLLLLLLLVLCMCVVLLCVMVGCVTHVMFDIDIHTIT
jgi:hypothetical protein